MQQMEGEQEICFEEYLMKEQSALNGIAVRKGG